LNLALAAAGVAVNILWAWLAGRECRRHGRTTLAAAVHAFAVFQAIVWAGSDPYLAAMEAPIALPPVATARTALELGAAAWTIAIAPASILIALGARLVRRSAAASR
jgi:hypothetical protein